MYNTLNGPTLLHKMFGEDVLTILCNYKSYTSSINVLLSLSTLKINISVLREYVVLSL